MYESLARQVPIQKTNFRAYRIERKPEHVVLRAIPTINSDHLARLDAHVMHEPVGHSENAIPKFAIGPLLPLEDKERVIRQCAQSVLFEDMGDENALAHDTGGEELDNLGGGGEAATGVLQVVGDVVFSIEVCGYRGGASCAGENGYCKLSDISPGFVV